MADLFTCGDTALAPLWLGDLRRAFKALRRRRQPISDKRKLLLTTGYHLYWIASGEHTFAGALGGGTFLNDHDEGLLSVYFAVRSKIKQAEAEGWKIKRVQVRRCPLNIYYSRTADDPRERWIAESNLAVYFSKRGGAGLRFIFSRCHTNLGAARRATYICPSCAATLPVKTLSRPCLTDGEWITEYAASLVCRCGFNALGKFDPYDWQGDEKIYKPWKCPKGFLR